MTPKNDWENLDNLTEVEAKLLLRHAISQFRIIKATVENPLDCKQYNNEGHALATGLASGFIVNWESRYKDCLPKISRD